MHFNFHLSGDESPEQSRRIANAVLALGGLLAPPKSVGEITVDLKLDTTKATAALDKLTAHPGFAQDPIVEMASGWYHYDETWSQVHGPYESREQAQAALDKYAETELNAPPYTEAEQFTGALTPDEIRAVESLPPAPPVPTTSATDAKGLPWDERIHSSNRKLNADGTWRYRKNVPDETKRDVEAELRGAITVGQIVTVPEVPSLNADLSNIVDYAGAKSIPVPPLPPTPPPAPPVPTGALQRTYSDVVNLIMSRKVQPDTYVAILGMSLPEFAKHVISAPNDATLMFDALDHASRSA